MSSLREVETTITQYKTQLIALSQKKGNTHKIITLHGLIGYWEGVRAKKRLKRVV